MLFKDRRSAGHVLAKHLAEYSGLDDAIVIGLPRGGVPVAYEVATSLGLPLDVYIVRMSTNPVEALADREIEDVCHREVYYRGDRAPLRVEGKSVILIDDGLENALTIRSAVHALKRRHAARVIVAIPVGHPAACRMVEKEADQLICLEQPVDGYSVAHWFDDFPPTSDYEVRELLEKAAAPEPAAADTGGDG